MLTDEGAGGKGAAEAFVYVPSLAGGTCDAACDQSYDTANAVSRRACRVAEYGWGRMGGRQYGGQNGRRYLQCAPNERKANAPCHVGADEHAAREAFERRSRA